MPCSLGANGVTHILSEREGWLHQILAENFPDIESLIAFGGVYLNKKRVRAPAWVKPGDYLRVHPEPRRFSVEAIDWRARVVHVHDDFVILNKPAGIPVHATLDNFHENAVHQTSQALHMELLVTHRIDNATSGLLVLARTVSFQSRFNRMLAERRAEKTYLALTETSVALGPHKHFMESWGRPPRVVHNDAGTGRWEIDLEVTGCETRGDFFQSSIRLLSGKPHQIRAQFSFLGAPLPGDVLYGGIETCGFHQERIALHSYSLRFSWKLQDLDFSCLPGWAPCAD